MSRRFLLATVFAGVAVFSSAHAQTTPNRPSTEQALTPEQVEELLPLSRDLLEGSLVDFEGARFRNVYPVTIQYRGPIWARRPAGQQQVLGFCGMINARNRMGGYNGWEMFSVSPDLPPEFQLSIGGLSTGICEKSTRLGDVDLSDRFAARP